jgi:hypothetical protein
VSSQRTKKLCRHAHRRDRSAAAVIFANGTYFVDTLVTHTRARARIILTGMGQKGLIAGYQKDFFIRLSIALNFSAAVILIFSFYSLRHFKIE